MFFNNKMTEEEYTNEIELLRNTIRIQQDNRYDIYEKNIDPDKLEKYIDKLEKELEKTLKRARKEHPGISL